MKNLTNKSFIAVLTFLLVVISIAVRVHSKDALGDENYTNSSTVAKSRMKRYLIFQPGSRILFRINIKDNLFKVNQIFAHAFGFRANIDLLQPHRPPLTRIAKREVYDTVEELINQHGFDGRACILKTFCDASREITPQDGMLFKLFKLIFTQSQSSNYMSPDDVKKYPYLNSNNCDELAKYCPLSLLEMTPYTDV